LANKSSYLTFLPPGLWEKDQREFSLGAMLRIFEKILSGIADNEVLTHGNHDHDSIEEVIKRLHQLFNPWTAPAEQQDASRSSFLDWLASWLGLEFSPLWDEYARRKITTQIAQIYLRRGLKIGLEKYLELYTVAATRPRIAIAAAC